MLKKINQQIKKGFTLVELVVTVSIVSVIMAVILFGYSSFNEDLRISSAEQEISLAIRQAQSYGLSVKEGSSGDFSKGYGISFDTTDPTNYYIFVDKNNDGKNSATSACLANSECVEKVTLRNAVRVSSVCGAVLVGDALNCVGVTSIHITFIRPSPDAIIRLYNGTTLVGTTYYRGQIKLTSAKGKIGTVTVDKTGQIYVQ